MTMQSSGPISIGQAINEINADGDPYGAVSNHAGDYSLSQLAGVSPGQQFAWSYWYNKSLGTPCVETNYYLQDNGSWSASMCVNLYNNVMIYRGIFSNPFGFTGDGSSVDSRQRGFPYANPTGGTIVALIRYSTYLTVVVQNGSLDGVHFWSSLGDNVTFSNSVAKTFQNGNVYTSYGATSSVGNTGGVRSCSIRFTGGTGAPPPALGA